ncbi:hypothetical protein BGZ95_007265, partial [Linnemannia exigua]
MVSIIKPAQTIRSTTLGDKEVQVALGDMYRGAKGVDQSYEVTVNWYLEATEQGDPIGQFKVGLFCSRSLA